MYKRQLPQTGNHEQNITHYLERLATRLERVRITCGTWQRALKPSVTRATATKPGTGIFLDPPYETGYDLYATTGGTENTISGEVREWCKTAPADYRIVLAGYDHEHAELESRGWVKIDGKSGGGAGYSTNSDSGRRERLWLSPACNRPDGMLDLFT